jgi:plasmid stabilization system protein ParE
MPRRLAYSDAAVDDIERMRRWFSQPGAGDIAKKRALRIAHAIRELQRDPIAWPPGPHRGTRQRHIEGYTVVYRVVPDTNDRRTAGDVYIVRLFGPGQDRAALE